MTPHPTPFLGLPEDQSDLAAARVVVVPYGYEGGVSYGKGTAGAPAAVIEASQYLELYDEVLDEEPCRVGIATLAQPEIPDDPQAMLDTLEQTVAPLLDREKFVVVVGGDHSITTGYVRALARHNADFGILQLDAHADLRDSYEGSPFSHACSMARIREMTDRTLQIGIRSMSVEEAQRIKDEDLALCTMHRYRKGNFDLEAELAQLPEKLFITVDVDVFDWSVITSTGTPEPGGMLWDEAMDILETVFHTKTVIGFDVVELAHRDHDPNSAFATAKLIYKMIGMRFAGKEGA
ncbi:agmatinase [Desulfosarcina ovata subsp. sediminis]|uniref:Agmatinase n=1 Tax=Desulfosarcina ovata subsp. sediminis TaxID=885957 RepID=A0A5K7ZIN3_9BACT|nr:agmatinase [Desulfosarcina ovata]BBO82088.1 agmatinase [Desulfosarcina ovata subsp. sediminis]